MADEHTPETRLYDRSGAQGRLELTDRDRFDLVHRMSTNDLLKDFAPGQGRATVLTTALARIIDLVIVFHRGESALLIANYPDTVRGWLGRHIFWQDRLKIRDVSAELGQLEVHGPASSAIAAQLTSKPESEIASLPPHSFFETDYQDTALLIARIPAIGAARSGGGYMLIAPVSALDSLKANIVAHGASRGNAADYDLGRIEAGLPGPNHELTEEYIPLEAGLWDAVSFTKGCYIGQEIIARMESRNKLARTLTRLELSGEAVPGAELARDDEGGTPHVVGTLTSAASRLDGSWIGLAFVKPDATEGGATLRMLRDGVQIGTARITRVAERATTESS